MNSEQTQIYKSTYEDYKDTVKHQLDTVRETHRRAIELIKYHLLISGGIIPVFNVVRDQTNAQPINLYLIFAICGMLYSIWATIHVHTPVSYSTGLESEAADQIEGLSEEEYYEALMYTYAKICDDNDIVLTDRTNFFKKGLWASFAGITLFAAALLRLLLPSYNPWYDLPIVITIGVLAVAGYISYSEEEEDLPTS